MAEDSSPSNPILVAQNTRMTVEIAQLGRKLGEANAYAERRTAQLNDAIREIERLTADCKRFEDAYDVAASDYALMEAERDRLLTFVQTFFDSIEKGYGVKVETDFPHDLRAFVRRARDAAALALAGAADKNRSGPRNTGDDAGAVTRTSDETSE